MQGKSLTKTRAFKAEINSFNQVCIKIQLENELEEILKMGYLNYSSYVIETVRDAIVEAKYLELTKLPKTPKELHKSSTDHALSILGFPSETETRNINDESFGFNEDDDEDLN